MVKDMIDTDRIRSELEAKVLELESRIRAVDTHLSSPGLADSEENALVHEDDEVLNKIGDATQMELRDVKLALNQLDAGNYGVCIECGERISSERLEALPFATNCIGCA